MESKYKCVREPLPGETTPTTPVDTVDPWTPSPGSNTPPPDEQYDESKRKPIWWYHSDHLGSSTYLTDNFGRPTHYYDNMPFGETMVEHNQSTFGKGKYDNAYKFNGKELDASTGMYYYGARYYDPRISIFVSKDPMADKTMTPYQYVHNNPIMFTDPTGMIANAIDGPGDEFKTFEEAFKDFGMTYNGFSIARNIEVSTLFYTYTDENNETKYSYILPHVGANGGMGKKLGPNDLKKFADKMGHKNAQFVNDGHTHGSGEGSHPMKEYKRDSYTTNEFSLGDIQYYVNEKGNPNPWGKRINGSMIAPTGEGFIFDESAHPEVNAGSIDRMYPGKLKKLSVPVIGGLPSDKIFEYSRSGRNSDYSDPKPEWLPVGFKPEEHVRRSGY